MISNEKKSCRRKWRDFFVNMNNKGEKDLKILGKYAEGQQSV